jgi:hypothetical protein
VAANSRRSVLLAAAAAGGLLIGAAGFNWAQNQLDISFHAFQDSRGVTVLSPDANFAKDFTDRTAIKVRFGVDAISAASDSCARCHPDGANNGRVVSSVNVTRKYGDTRVNARRRVQPREFLRGHHCARLRCARSEQEQHDGGRRFRLLVQPASTPP